MRLGLLPRGTEGYLAVSSCSCHQRHLAGDNVLVVELLTSLEVQHGLGLGEVAAIDSD